MGSKDSWGRWGSGPMWIVFLVFALFPYIPFFGRYLSLGTEVLVWSLFALGFNILLGYTGLASFGHGAFFGIGAYAAGIFFLNVSKGVWGPLFMAVAVSGVFAALVGLLVAKKRGIYFSLITIAISQVFYFVAFRWEELTGGETGLSGIDRVNIGFPGLELKISPPLNYYYFVLVVFMLCTLLIWRLVHSPFGKVLQSIRENEVRAKYLGYNTAVYKWGAFAISGLFAGLAGGLYTLLINSAFAGSRLDRVGQRGDDDPPRRGDGQFLRPHPRRGHLHRVEGSAQRLLGIVDAHLRIDLRHGHPLHPQRHPWAHRRQETTILR